MGQIYAKNLLKLMFILDDLSEVFNYKTLYNLQ